MGMRNVKRHRLSRKAMTVLEMVLAIELIRKNANSHEIDGQSVPFYEDSTNDDTFRTVRYSHR